VRFPWSLYRVMTPYLIGRAVRRVPRFPLVLMLEPTERCNLDCVGCARIEAQKTDPVADLPLDSCLRGIDECPAPVVVITGGEPLLYGRLTELIEAALARRRYVYLCTNALLLDRRLDAIPRHPRFCFTIHLDGLRDTHDRITACPGAFDRVVSGIRAAKARGFRVFTNTTVFTHSALDEVRALFAELKAMGVDGLLVAPGFAASGPKGEAALGRERSCDAFRHLFPDARSQAMLASSPVYLAFLKGERMLRCTPWGSPNLTPRGWKRPCYVMDDAYCERFADLMDGTDWDAYGPGRDPRCENCMIHSGFEPTIALGRDATWRDHLAMLRWNLTG